MIVLIVDDDPGLRQSIHERLKNRHEVHLCENGPKSIEMLEKIAVDLVITDYQPSQLSGLDIIKKGKEDSPSTSFILMTAFGSMDQAVDGIRAGAEDYFVKPFDMEEMERRVQRIEKLRRWRSENTIRKETLQGVQRLAGISSFIVAAKSFISQAGGSAAPVILQGPNGCGKQTIARAIHESSSRSLRPFLTIHCALLTPTELESELFGTEKKVGRFELAIGGTVFLNQIGALPDDLQTKLLHVIQTKEFQKKGSDPRLQKTDARVIVASQTPLQGNFGSLGALSLVVPPLKERREDIGPLIDFFMKTNPRLDASVQSKLSDYGFPGNVRELRNILERTERA